jgi:hypothetical protein
VVAAGRDIALCHTRFRAPAATGEIAFLHTCSEFFCINEKVSVDKNRADTFVRQISSK